MIKLFAQIFTAAALIGLSVEADWPISVTLILMVIGFLLVHTIWKRFIFKPFLCLRTKLLDPNDPLMTEAREEAKRTLPMFARLYRNHRNDSSVKFEFETDQGQREFLWGDLLELTESEAKVFIRTPPVNHEGKTEREQTIPITSIVDWQVEFPDGSLRGGFTNLATFKIFEREEGYMHPLFLAQVDRFKSLTEEELG